MASALIAGSFSVGNIIGPQTFQARDAPQYRPAKITVLATQAAGAFLAMVLYGYYRFANHLKDRKHGVIITPEATTEVDRWANRTDRQNERFRYVY